ANQKLSGTAEEWEVKIWRFAALLSGTVETSIKVSTSGSTGTPKIIEHGRKALLSSAAMTCNALQLQKGNTALLCLPADKIGGMMMIARSFYMGMKLVCIKPSLKVLHEINALQIDFASFTPMQFSDILQDDAAFDSAAAIPKIILGGEGVQPALLEKIKQLPNAVYSTFGMTETISHIALKKLNGADADKYYRVLPGVSISADARNCLVIEAPLLGQPHLVTNDVVNIVAANEFEWLGRDDNVINTGGVKLQPEVIENTLRDKMPFPFFVAGVADAVSGFKPVLVVEAPAVAAQELMAIQGAVATLDKISQPKEMVLITGFIYTGTGKINRATTLLQPVTKRIAL
ncbi:MAG TPA: AMP-binding protein, partial [Chitinophagales bacterium]|nr:AMP-binding protein [Chitinophagales bacterium]